MVRSVVIAEFTPNVAQSLTCDEVAAVDVLASAEPGFALITTEKAADMDVSLPSLTDTLMPEAVPVADGVPDSAPVEALMDNHDGAPTNEYVSASPSASVADGVVQL